MDKLKQQMTELPVPTDKLDAAILQGIAKATPPKRKKRGYKVALTAVATVMLTIGSGFVSPTMANVMAKVPILESLFAPHDSVGQKIAEDGLMIPLDQTLRYAGTTIKLQSLYFDGMRFGISYETDAKDVFVTGTVWIDGEEQHTASGGKQADERGYGYFYLDAPASDSFALKMQLKFGDMAGTKAASTTLKQQISLPAHFVTSTKPQVKGEFGEVTSLHHSPYTTTVKVALAPSYDFTKTMDEPVIRDLRFIDITGKAIPVVGQFGSEQDGVAEMTYILATHQLSALDIQPYTLALPYGKKMRVPIDAPLPITLGEVTITAREQTDDEVSYQFTDARDFTFDHYYGEGWLQVVDEVGNSYYRSAPVEQLGKNHYRYGFPATTSPLYFEYSEREVLKYDETQRIRVDLP